MFRNAIRAGTLARSFTKRNNELSYCFKKPISLIISRQINTTDKQKDSHIEVYDPKWIDRKKPKGPQTAEEFADYSSNKNWISFGFDHVNKDNDRFLFHSAMFFFVTIGCICASYILLYFPDYNLNDWAMREAFLELDRREKAGLPLIDCNLVDPAKIELPSEEELGDYQVYL